MEAIAKTYRYLDADEISAKRKAEKEAKVKSGGKG
jgi:Tfp pilus assembly protein PilO